MTMMLRFRDLKARQIVSSWPQLKHLQEDHGFPTGRMLSPNIRAWTEQEVSEWISGRPQENSMPLKGVAKAKHARRQREAR